MSAQNQLVMIRSYYREDVAKRVQAIQTVSFFFSLSCLLECLQFIIIIQQKLPFRHHHQQPYCRFHSFAFIENNICCARE